MTDRRFHTGRYASVIVFGLLLAFPLIYLVAGSLMTRGEIAQNPPPLFPATPIWSNFTEAIGYLNPRSILNSFIFVLGVLLVQLAVCLPAGFALAKIPFRWSAIIIGIFLVPIFIPTNLILIPTYVVTYKLGLVNTFAGLILPIAGQASVGVILFRQFFAGLPNGLIEAARIDGASWFQTFIRIALPLSRPIVASYSVITFLTAWNLYVWPLIAGSGEDTRVLTVALAPLAGGQFSLISPSVTFAGAVITMLPVLAVFIAFQKWFTKGVVGTGLE
jgi:ABC-type glycerol-3-phosphate transport system permease component